MTTTIDATEPTADASEVKMVSAKSPESGFNWSVVAKVSAAFSALGGLSLPLVGASTHAQYFREWGLDAAMFPIAADMTFVYGYEALVHGFGAALLSVFKDYWPVLLGYGLLCVGTMLLVVKESQYRAVFSEFLRRKEKLGKLLRLSIACLLAMALPTVAIPFAAVSALLVLALPISAAESYAKDRVNRQIADFKIGCEMASKIRGAKCLKAVKNGEQVAYGFLIGSSESHVALFDPVLMDVVLLERAGATLTSGPRPIPNPSAEGS